MYWPDYTPYPSKPWVLRCIATGLAYPNREGYTGWHPTRFHTCDAALAYAERNHIDLFQPFYYRDADGHTYWMRDGQLWGAPTFVDGRVDFNNAGPVDSFDLEPGYLRELKREIMEALG